MIQYQFRKQRKYEIKKFVDEANLLFIDCERLLDIAKRGTQNSPEGLTLQQSVTNKFFNLRALNFLIMDSAYITNENKKISAEIYSNFARMLNKQSYDKPHMQEVRNLLNKLKY